MSLEQLTEINGIKARVIRHSKSPIPLNESIDSMPDAIWTKIIYSDNGKEIVISIPSVPKEKIRFNILHVEVDGKAYAFNAAGLELFDMDKTFDLPEMQRLINILLNDAQPARGDTLRTSLPFICLDHSDYVLPEYKSSLPADGYLYKTNGSIRKIISPYLHEMQKLNTAGKTRELYFPVATMGEPHHWNVCILTIDANNKPSLTYLETSGSIYRFSAAFYAYAEDYADDILPAINMALAENGYSQIPEHELKFSVSKQFSESGCGFASALNIQKLVTARLHLSTDNMLDYNKIQSKKYGGVSIEEDAVCRVQLALSLTYHDNCLAKLNIPGKYKFALEAVLRELTTHNHSLTIKAREAFATADPHKNVFFSRSVDQPAKISKEPTGPRMGL